jgi:hypothetical protein
MQKSKKISKNKKNKTLESIELKDIALRYMKSLAEIVREPILIMDFRLRVILTNQIFCQKFSVSSKQTKNVVFFKLKNNQWDIPVLRRLLEEILPNKEIIRDYEITHVFRKIGEKTMLFNGRRLDSVQLIILTIKDVTKEKQSELKMTDYTRDLEIKAGERTKELAERLGEVESLNKVMVGREIKMVELKKEIERLKKKIKNGNGNGKNGNGNHKKE